MRTVMVIAVVATIRDLTYAKAPATLVYTSNLDGSDLVQVTPWDNELVPMVGE